MKNVVYLKTVMMIDPKMREEIVQKIQEIEKDHQVRVLYACESGSRAWGFASQNSDYDVRFIYVHPRDHYLSIDKKSDVIEVPISDDLDLAGWDLPKALGLLRKSNPPLLEWIQSPIVYQSEDVFLAEFKALAEKFYAARSCQYHYLRMASNNIESYLLGESVRTKKYFYALRPILACQWIEKGYGMVPIEFEVMVNRLVVDAKLRKIIDDLLVQKKSGQEMDEAPRIEYLSQFLFREMERLRQQEVEIPSPPSSEILNEFFRKNLF